MNLEQIWQNIETARQKCGVWENVRLIAVSKNVDTDAVENLYSQGQIEFGENRVQEMKRKCEILSDLPLKWHFIGSLQSNKINHLLSLRPTLWQSCNSFELALAVDKRANFTLDTLLEINSADESSKSGIEISRAIDEYLKIKESCENLNLCGVMSIGAHSDDENEIAKSFETTFRIFENLRQHGAKICSMGMSDDYELAIKCGSNMVRLGRILYR
ncbi:MULTISPECIES: YggS family pyridoxal phosphate-dependent enzyme [unclassified Campylobacter]|uniref:YggS family pyridoxal phosphate-dependent enzyme n=1 Tax=unclassified Campylobacter TaxID=2593542 RepID=UPI0022E9F111|nr:MULTISPECIES: YggS family pyridoxal phosphate-dependent enzyme [unclassified Campylobacter]MDA3056734.1 YggS family pyridoxal phosphate-dependent enzyme [Campylobacter sp. CN_NA1]MDA3065977.1 YggS family pyridoxal phosphate-dependent enzyme [Campylobacter sp. CN_NE4]MDA3069067.1 YggS family pyridoxal phosphate-dependent enzyme [Campylobacter sp. CN_NE3]MDA3083303.1 YggS family pyridoxal phosphate-dependent enzyme [Campylobacter sp. CN_EL2]MDA3084760.1 YggS family pyridoxal phosphate-depende